MQHCLLFLLALALAPLQAATLQSSWSSGAYKARAPAGKSWSEARNAVRMDRGWLFARNDADNLYLLVDVTGDVVNDRPSRRPPGGDSVAVTVDVDRNGKITPGRDLQYGQEPGTYKLMSLYADRQGRFADKRKTAAKLYAGFTTTLNLRRQHRVWELVIPLKELSAKPGGTVRLGIDVRSERPEFVDSLPSNTRRDVGKFVEIRLATNPRIFHMVEMRRLPAKVGVIDRIVIRPDFSKLVRPGGNLAIVPPAPETCPMPEGDPVERAILPNGYIELTYGNGSKKRQVENGWEYVCPDGRVFMAQAIQKYTAAPGTLDPTDLPGGADHDLLLNAHASELLSIIGALVNNNQEMVDNYANSEDAEWDIVERIGARGKAISYLLAE
jgi:hypothetical protein